MLSQSNIARPYAQALFELAQEQDRLAGWNDQLQLLASITCNSMLLELANNPRFSSSQLADLIIHICDDKLDKKGQNLVKLVVHNGRFSALSDIASAYAALRAKTEKTINAKMITAVAIDEQRQQIFAQTLQKKLGCTVEIAYEVDETLIGGAVIRAGDWVVDGSVKAALERLVGLIGSQ